MIFSGKHMYGYCLATALILPVTAVASGLTIPGSTPAPDSSSSQREEIARTVVRLAQQYHYPAETLNGNFSKRMLLEYVDTLDPQHSYFTRKDIDNLNKEFGDALPTDLEAGKLGPAFSIYALYDTRVHQRIDYALKQLSGKPDFKGKEVYRYKRSHAPFPTDRKALDLLWGKQVKNDAITIMLAAHTWDDTARILKNRYNSLLSNTIHASKNKILTLYLNSYMQTLDPHSAYFSNFQAERFDSRISLRSGGIGARLNFRNGYITLEHIFPGGAAAKTRVLKPGDRIVGIGQGQTGTILNIVGWNPDTVNKMTRGRVGTKIRLLVLPTGESAEAKKITVTLVRTNIGLDGERAEARILSSQIGPFAYSIGVIRIPSFYSNLQSSGHNIPKVANDVSYLVRQLRNRNVSAILLDLRYNNGGSLKQALALAGLFIPQGPVVQIENHYGKIQVLDTPADSVPIWRGPLGILVNRFSASATEIFTEAMKTYNRAVIFGSRTWGKGTIQTLIPLHKYLPRLKAGEIKLTVAQYFGVNGSGIQLHGIQPDINIPTHTDLKISGEEALANALPWENVAAIKYKPVDENINAARLRLKKYFQKKIEKETSFQLFERNQALRRILANRTSVSLNISKRRTELKQRHMQNRGSEDMALKASIELLGEYVSFSPSVALKFENKLQSPDVAPGNNFCWWSSVLFNTPPFSFSCPYRPGQTIRPPPVSSTGGSLKGPGLQR